MKNQDYDILVLDEEHRPIITEVECRNFNPILQDFVRTYAQNPDIPVETWLGAKMQEFLPEKSDEEIKAITDEIVTTIKVNEQKRESLHSAMQNGRSKESWFASEVKQATSAMAAQEASAYLTNLDSALNAANESLYQTITTQAGSISQNPCLDGFIAEQYHVQTFNLKAASTGSEYRAKVLEPNGTYAKNSVDIVIVDGNGKTVKRYQSKYCKDADATSRAFEHGDYRGQQKLVPEGQEAEITKKCSTVIEAPDGTTSNPLSKAKAEQLRDEAQSGKWNDLNWNEYKTKDLAIGIGKQAGVAALQGAAIGVGIDIAQKLWNGEEIKGEEIVETALVSGADFGIKAAAAGALKVAVEKNIVTVIPKGTTAGTITNIVYVAVENIKIIGKMAKGELSFKEAVDKMEQTTVSTVAGLVAMKKGAEIGVKIGAVIGNVLGPHCAAIGWFIGGSIGYMAGSKMGETVVKGVQKIREKAKDTLITIGDVMQTTANNVKDHLSNGFRKFRSIFAH